MEVINKTSDFSSYLANNSIDSLTKLYKSIVNLPLFSDFTKFIISTNIIQIGFGFIIASNSNKIATDFVETFISPIINFILGGSNESNLKDYIITIFGINFQIGSFIVSLLKFIIMIFLLYYTFRFLGIIDLLQKNKSF